MIVRDAAGRPVVQVAGDVAALDDLVRRLRWLRDRLAHDGVSVPELLEPLVDDTARVAALTALAVADVGHIAGGASAAGPELTTTEAVVLLGIPARTLRRWLAAGRVPGARCTTAGWLIPAASLKEAASGRS